MVSPEQFRQAGLFDPVSDEGTGRLELLQWLADRGVSVDDMKRAIEDGTLGALAGDRRLAQGERLSNEEAAAAVGISVERLISLATAFGVTPPELTWLGHTDRSGEPSAVHELGLSLREAQAVAAFDEVSEMFSEDETFGFMRVIGSSIGRIADAAVALFLVDVEGPSLVRSPNELELARNVLAAVELLDHFAPVFDSMLRRHVAQAIDRSRSSIIDEWERLQYRYAVGFIDLVGFTPLSHDMSAAELGVFLRDFEARAHDVVTRAGARLVKFIGDEVMFVAPDANSACRAASALMAEHETSAGRAVVPRGGVAYGPVLVRGGDYYGDVVTIASRLADDAEPRELLVTEEFAVASTTIGFDGAEKRSLKGIDDPVAIRSRVFEP